MSTDRARRLGAGMVVLAGLWAGGAAAAADGPAAPPTSVIVQAKDHATARAVVEEVGAAITHHLPVIRAVAAEVDARQRTVLEGDGRLRVLPNRGVEVAAKPTGSNDNPGTSLATQESHYPTLIGADRLHAYGIDGRGVGVAIVDTGIFHHSGLVLDPDGAYRIAGGYDSLFDLGFSQPLLGLVDANGHGSHVASVLASSLRTRDGKYNGVAPGVSLVPVRAFDDLGTSTYADVIRAIGWVVGQRDALGIRVLNLSFSAAPRSRYWEDPLNQAVMAAWQEGIVVVTSAGNLGPEPLTVAVPGNVPYVITVGAMTDTFTPEDGTDDRLASFSSAGPTTEGFVKPEVVAPGGHILGLMPKNAHLSRTYRELFDGRFYFTMSGTSQAAAVTSGLVALLLQAAPWLEPDEVKCLLMSSARPALDDQGELAYSVFQQGAGLVHAVDAVVSAWRAKRAGEDLSCANRGLRLDHDLSGAEHYRGRAVPLEGGGYAIEDLDGFIWSDGYVWSDGFIWADGYVWSDGFIWSDGYVWSDSCAWSGAFVGQDGYVWSDVLAEPARINVWVDQE